MFLVVTLEEDNYRDEEDTVNVRIPIGTAYAWSRRQDLTRSSG